MADMKYCVKTHNLIFNLYTKHLRSIESHADQNVVTKIINWIQDMYLRFYVPLKNFALLCIWILQLFYYVLDFFRLFYLNHIFSDFQPFGLSTTDETSLVEMRIWCIKIGIVLVLHSYFMHIPSLFSYNLVHQSLWIYCCINYHSDIHFNQCPGVHSLIFTVLRTAQEFFIY
jgi:hypothetical protein